MRVRTALVVVALALATPALGSAEPADDPTPEARGKPDATAPTAPTIAPRDAASHVGEEVVIEGRVHGVHVSHLATVFAFAPNFAGFTATIHTADRARFPKNVHETARDRSVRLRGLVRAYRGRPEMTLRDPSQLVVLDAPPPRTAVDENATEIRAALQRIEQRLDGLERRLDGLERPASETNAELLEIP